MTNGPDEWSVEAELTVTVAGEPVVGAEVQGSIFGPAPLGTTSGDQTDAFGQAYIGFNVVEFGTYTVVIDSVVLDGSPLPVGSPSGAVVVDETCM